MRIKIIVVFGLLLLLVGCGQTGPLYLPEKAQAQQPKHSHEGANTKKPTQQQL